MPRRIRIRVMVGPVNGPDLTMRILHSVDIDLYAPREGFTEHQVRHELATRGSQIDGIVDGVCRASRHGPRQNEELSRG